LYLRDPLPSREERTEWTGEEKGGETGEGMERKGEVRQ